MAEQKRRGRKPSPTPPEPRVLHDTQETSFGWTRIVERRYQWDRATKNTRNLGQKTIGYLPPGCTDTTRMVPRKVFLQACREERARLQRLERGEQAEGVGPEAKRAAGPVVDQSSDDSLHEAFCALVQMAAKFAEEQERASRFRDAGDPEKDVCQICRVLLLLMMCSGMDLESSQDISVAWEAWRHDFARVFKDPPERDLSRDTARNFCIALDKCDPGLLFEQFAAMFALEPGACEPFTGTASPEQEAAFQRSVLALDRQAIRAGKITVGKEGARSSFAIFDTSFAERPREQAGEAADEIARAKRLLRRLDTQNALVAVDARHSQVELLQGIIEAGADYCVAVGDNRPDTRSDVRKAFDAPENGPLVKTITHRDKQHGPDGTLVLNVLPGSVLGPETARKWPGLENGSIVRAVRTRTEEASGKTSVETGCFISSLNHDLDWTLPSLLDVIRRHQCWHQCIENEPQWLLDVTYPDPAQGHAQFADDDCLLRVTALHKLMHAFASDAMALLSREYGEPVSMPMLKPHLTGLTPMLTLIAKVCVDRSEQTKKA